MSNYIVPKGEERLFHVRQELVQYDPKTGRKLSKPSIKKYGMKIFLTNLRDRLTQQGYTLEILSDPRTYAERMKAEAEAKAAAEKAEAEAKKKAEAEVKKAAAAAKKAAEKETAAKDATPGGAKKED